MLALLRGDVVRFVGLQQCLHGQPKLVTWWAVCSLRKLLITVEMHNSDVPDLASNQLSSLLLYSQVTVVITKFSTY